MIINRDSAINWTKTPFPENGLILRMGGRVPATSDWASGDVLIEVHNYGDASITEHAQNGDSPSVTLSQGQLRDLLTVLQTYHWEKEV